MIAMRMGPGKHLKVVDLYLGQRYVLKKRIKGLTLMNGVVTPEEVSALGQNDFLVLWLIMSVSSATPMNWF